jgi:TolB protein
VKPGETKVSRLSMMVCASVLLAVSVPGTAFGAPAETRADGAELLYRPPGLTASAQNAAFSPDGKTVLLTLFPDNYNQGAARLELLDPGSGAEPAVLLAEGDQSAVNLPGSSWNGPAGLVTFSFDRTDLDEVWTMKPVPGSSPKRVTEHAKPRGFTEPSFSPDGVWIVFQENLDQDGQAASGSIWKVRADGSNLTRLVDGPGTGTDNREPNWSPRGDRIVFQSHSATAAAGTWDLVTVAPDGTAPLSLTNGGENTDASWSPEGTRVVYSSDLGVTGRSQLFVTSGLSVGTPVQVTHVDAVYSGAPSWSPDGHWIAFESTSGPGESPTALWRIQAP